MGATAGRSSSSASREVLIEHRSSEDRWMVVRIARSVLRIWERDIERDPRRESLPPDSRDLRGAAAWLTRWARLIRDLVARGDVGRVLTVVRYPVSVRPDLDLDAFERSADAIALGAGEPIMTTARQLIEHGFEKWIEKGRLEGIAKGRLEGVDAGRRDTLRRLLERRFG